MTQNSVRVQGAEVLDVSLLVILPSNPGELSYPIRISKEKVLVKIDLMWLYSSGHTETRNPRMRRGVVDEPIDDETVSRCI
jgi:hypothetical protein